MKPNGSQQEKHTCNCQFRGELDWSGYRINLRCAKRKVPRLVHCKNRSRKRRTIWFPKYLIFVLCVLEREKVFPKKKWVFLRGLAQHELGKFGTSMICVVVAVRIQSEHLESHNVCPSTRQNQTVPCHLRLVHTILQWEMKNAHATMIKESASRARNDWESNDAMKSARLFCDYRSDDSKQGRKR